MNHDEHLSSWRIANQAPHRLSISLSPVGLLCFVLLLVCVSLADRPDAKIANNNNNKRAISFARAAATPADHGSFAGDEHFPYDGGDDDDFLSRHYENPSDVFRELLQRETTAEGRAEVLRFMNKHVRATSGTRLPPSATLASLSNPVPSGGVAGAAPSAASRTAASGPRTVVTQGSVVRSRRTTSTGPSTTSASTSPAPTRGAAAAEPAHRGAAAPKDLAKSDRGMTSSEGLLLLTKAERALEEEGPKAYFAELGYNELGEPSFSRSSDSLLPLPTDDDSPSILACSTDRYIGFAASPSPLRILGLFIAPVVAVLIDGVPVTSFVHMSLYQLTLYGVPAHPSPPPELFCLTNNDVLDDSSLSPAQQLQQSCPVVRRAVELEVRYRSLFDGSIKRWTTALEASQNPRCLLERHSDYTPVLLSISTPTRVMRALAAFVPAATTRADQDDMELQTEVERREDDAASGHDGSYSVFRVGMGSTDASVVACSNRISSFRTAQLMQIQRKVNVTGGAIVPGGVLQQQREVDLSRTTVRMGHFTYSSVRTIRSRFGDANGDVIAVLPSSGRLSDRAWHAASVAVLQTRVTPTEAIASNATVLWSTGKLRADWWSTTVAESLYAPRDAYSLFQVLPTLTEQTMLVSTPESSFIDQQGLRFVNADAEAVPTTSHVLSISGTYPRSTHFSIDDASSSEGIQIRLKTLSIPSLGLPQSAVDAITSSDSAAGGGDPTATLLSPSSSSSESSEHAPMTTTTSTRPPVLTQTLMVPVNGSDACALQSATSRNVTCRTTFERLEFSSQGSSSPLSQLPSVYRPDRLESCGGGFAATAYIEPMEYDMSTGSLRPSRRAVVVAPTPFMLVGQSYFRLRQMLQLFPEILTQFTSFAMSPSNNDTSPDSSASASADSHPRSTGGASSDSGSNSDSGQDESSSHEAIDPYQYLAGFNYTFVHEPMHRGAYRIHCHSDSIMQAFADHDGVESFVLEDGTVDTSQVYAPNPVVSLCNLHSGDVVRNRDSSVAIVNAKRILLTVRCLHPLVLYHNDSALLDRAQCGISFEALHLETKLTPIEELPRFYVAEVSLPLRADTVSTDVQPYQGELFIGLDGTDAVGPESPNVLLKLPRIRSPVDCTRFARSVYATSSAGHRFFRNSAGGVLSTYVQSPTEAYTHRCSFYVAVPIPESGAAAVACDSIVLRHTSYWDAPQAEMYSQRIFCGSRSYFQDPLASPQMSVPLSMVPALVNLTTLVPMPQTSPRVYQFCVDVRFRATYAENSSYISTYHEAGPLIYTVLDTSTSNPPFAPRWTAVSVISTSSGTVGDEKTPLMAGDTVHFIGSDFVYHEYNDTYSVPLTSNRLRVVLTPVTFPDAHNDSTAGNTSEISGHFFSGLPVMPKPIELHAAIVNDTMTSLLLPEDAPGGWYNFSLESPEMGKLAGPNRNVGSLRIYSEVTSVLSTSPSGIGGGTTIVISGRNFPLYTAETPFLIGLGLYDPDNGGTAEEAAEDTISGKYLCRVTESSATQIKCVTPAIPVGVVTDIAYTRDPATGYFHVPLNMTFFYYDENHTAQVWQEITTGDVANGGGSGSSSSSSSSEGDSVSGSNSSSGSNSDMNSGTSTSSSAASVDSNSGDKGSLSTSSADGTIASSSSSNSDSSSSSGGGYTGTTGIPTRPPVTSSTPRPSTTTTSTTAPAPTVPPPRSQTGDSGTLDTPSFAEQRSSPHVSTAWLAQYGAGRSGTDASTTPSARGVAGGPAARRDTANSAWFYAAYDVSVVVVTSLTPTVISCMDPNPSFTLTGTDFVSRVIMACEKEQSSGGDDAMDSGDGGGVGDCYRCYPHDFSTIDRQCRMSKEVPAGVYQMFVAERPVNPLRFGFESRCRVERSTPSVVYPYGGATVTLVGEGFYPDLSVVSLLLRGFDDEGLDWSETAAGDFNQTGRAELFNATVAITSINTTHVTFVMPNIAAMGYADGVVVVPSLVFASGQRTLDGALIWALPSAELPTISSFSPLYGQSPLQVTVYGTGFTKRRFSPPFMAPDDLYVDVGFGHCEILDIFDTRLVCNLTEVCYNGFANSSLHLVSRVYGATLPADESAALFFSCSLSVTSLSHTRGSVAGGLKVSVTGAGFNPDPTQLSVTVAGIPCEVTSATSSTINCTTGSTNGRLALGPVVVGIPAVGTTASCCLFEYSNDATPIITDVTPSSGIANSRMSIRGSGFLGWNASSADDPDYLVYVLFGTLELPVRPISDTLLTLIIPSYLFGRDYVAVRVPGFGVSARAKKHFTALMTPSVVSPASGGFTNRLQVTLTGTSLRTDLSPAELQRTVEVRICGKTCPIAGTTAAGEVICTVPDYMDESMVYQFRSVLGFPVLSSGFFVYYRTGSFAATVSTAAARRTMEGVLNIVLDYTPTDAWVSTTLFATNDPTETQTTFLSSNLTFVVAARRHSRLMISEVRLVLTPGNRGSVDWSPSRCTLQEANDDYELNALFEEGADPDDEAMWNASALWTFPSLSVGENKLSFNARDTLPTAAYFRIRCSGMSPNVVLSDATFRGYQVGLRESGGECPVDMASQQRKDQPPLHTCERRDGYTCSFFVYDYASTPIVTSIDPVAQITTIATDPVTLYGTGFGDSVDDLQGIVLDGALCVPLTVTPTKITCMLEGDIYVENFLRSVTGSSMWYNNSRGVGYFLVSQNFLAAVAWSSYLAWGNNPPERGDTVVIESTRAVVLDVSPPPLDRLLISGRLIAPDIAPLTLTVNSLIVSQTGELIVGQPEAPYTNEFTLRLSRSGAGDEDEIRVVEEELSDSLIAYTKHITVLGGRIQMVGASPSDRGSYLLHAIAVGDTVLTVTDRVDWKVGAVIAVTSSSIYQYETEARTIVGRYLNGSTAVITVDAPFEYAHDVYPGVLDDPNVQNATVWRDWTVPTVLRGSLVFLVSRNIAIRGDERSSSSLMGGTMLLAYSSTSTFVNVEFSRMGKLGTTLGYAIWHRRGQLEASRTIMDLCAVRESYFRGVVMQSMRNVRVSRLFLFNTNGHGVSLVDAYNRGIEIDEITTFGHGAERGSIDGVPTGVVITHPDVSLTNNFIGYSEGNGVWFDLRGYHASETIASCPSHSPMTSFNNNTVLRNRFNGLVITPEHYVSLARCGTTTAPMATAGVLSNNAIFTCRANGIYLPPSSGYILSNNLVADVGTTAIIMDFTTNLTDISHTIMYGTLWDGTYTVFDTVVTNDPDETEEEETDTSTSAQSEGEGEAGTEQSALNRRRRAFVAQHGGFVDFNFCTVGGYHNGTLFTFLTALLTEQSDNVLSDIYAYYLFARVLSVELTTPYRTGVVLGGQALFRDRTGRLSRTFRDTYVVANGAYLDGTNFCEHYTPETHGADSVARQYAAGPGAFSSRATSGGTATNVGKILPPAERLVVPDNDSVHLSICYSPSQHLSLFSFSAKQESGASCPIIDVFGQYDSNNTFFFSANSTTPVADDVITILLFTDNENDYTANGGDAILAVDDHLLSSMYLQFDGYQADHVTRCFPTSVNIRSVAYVPGRLLAVTRVAVDPLSYYVNVPGAPTDASLVAEPSAMYMTDLYMYLFPHAADTDVLSTTTSGADNQSTAAADEGDNVDDDVTATDESLAGASAAEGSFSNTVTLSGEYTWSQADTVRCPPGWRCMGPYYPYNRVLLEQQRSAAEEATSETDDKLTSSDNNSETPKVDSQGYISWFDRAAWLDGVAPWIDDSDRPEHLRYQYVIPYGKKVAIRNANATVNGVVFVFGELLITDEAENPDDPGSVSNATWGGGESPQMRLYLESIVVFGTLNILSRDILGPRIGVKLAYCGPTMVPLRPPLRVDEETVIYPGTLYVSGTARLEGWSGVPTAWETTRPTSKGTREWPPLRSLSNPSNTMRYLLTDLTPVEDAEARSRLPSWFFKTRIEDESSVMWRRNDRVLLTSTSIYMEQEEVNVAAQTTYGNLTRTAVNDTLTSDAVPGDTVVNEWAYDHGVDDLLHASPSVNAEAAVLSKNIRLSCYHDDIGTDDYGCTIVIKSQRFPTGLYNAPNFTAIGVSVNNFGKGNQRALGTFKAPTWEEQQDPNATQLVSMWNFTGTFVPALQIATRGDARASVSGCVIQTSGGPAVYTMSDSTMFWLLDTVVWESFGGGARFDGGESSIYVEGVLFAGIHYYRNLGRIQNVQLPPIKTEDMMVSSLCGILTNFSDSAVSSGANLQKILNVVVSGSEGDGLCLLWDLGGAQSGNRVHSCYNGIFLHSYFSADGYSTRGSKGEPFSGMRSYLNRNVGLYSSSHQQVTFLNTYVYANSIGVALALSSRHQYGGATFVDSSISSFSHCKDVEQNFMRSNVLGGTPFTSVNTCQYSPYADNLANERSDGDYSFSGCGNVSFIDSRYHYAAVYAMPTYQDFGLDYNRSLPITATYTFENPDDSFEYPILGSLTFENVTFGGVGQMQCTANDNTPVTVRGAAVIGGLKARSSGSVTNISFEAVTFTSTDSPALEDGTRPENYLDPQAIIRLGVSDLATNVAQPYRETTIIDQDGSLFPMNGRGETFYRLRDPLYDRMCNVSAMDSTLLECPNLFLFLQLLLRSYDKRMSPLKDIEFNLTMTTQRFPGRYGFNTELHTTTLGDARIRGPGQVAPLDLLLPPEEATNFSNPLTTVLALTVPVGSTTNIRFPYDSYPDVFSLKSDACISPLGTNMTYVTSFRLMDYDKTVNVWRDYDLTTSVQTPATQNELVGTQTVYTQAIANASVVDTVRLLEVNPLLWRVTTTYDPLTGRPDTHLSFLIACGVRIAVHQLAYGEIIFYTHLTVQQVQQQATPLTDALPPATDYTPPFTLYISDVTPDPAQSRSSFVTLRVESDDSADYDVAASSEAIARYLSLFQVYGETPVNENADVGAAPADDTPESISAPHTKTLSSAPQSSWLGHRLPRKWVQKQRHLSQYYVPFDANVAANRRNSHGAAERTAVNGTQKVSAVTVLSTRYFVSGISFYSDPRAQSDAIFRTTSEHLTVEWSNAQLISFVVIMGAAILGLFIFLCVRHLLRNGFERRFAFSHIRRYRDRKKSEIHRPVTTPPEISAERASLDASEALPGKSLDMNEKAAAPTAGDHRATPGNGAAATAPAAAAGGVPGPLGQRSAEQGVTASPVLTQAQRDALRHRGLSMLPDSDPLPTVETDPQTTHVAERARYLEQWALLQRYDLRNISRELYARGIFTSTDIAAQFPYMAAFTRGTTATTFVEENNALAAPIEVGFTGTGGDKNKGKDSPGGGAAGDQSQRNDASTYYSASMSGVAGGGGGNRIVNGRPLVSILSSKYSNHAPANNSATTPTNHAVNSNNNGSLSLPTSPSVVSGEFGPAGAGKKVGVGFLYAANKVHQHTTEEVASSSPAVHTPNRTHLMEHDNISADDIRHALAGDLDDLPTAAAPAGGQTDGASESPTGSPATPVPAATADTAEAERQQHASTNESVSRIDGSAAAAGSVGAVGSVTPGGSLVRGHSESTGASQLKAAAGSTAETSAAAPSVTGECAGTDTTNTITTTNSVAAPTNTSSSSTEAGSNAAAAPLAAPPGAGGPSLLPFKLPPPPTYLMPPPVTLPPEGGGGSGAPTSGGAPGLPPQPLLPLPQLPAGPPGGPKILPFGAVRLPGGTSPPIVLPGGATAGPENGLRPTIPQASPVNTTPNAQQRQQGSNGSGSGSPATSPGSAVGSAGGGVGFASQDPVPSPGTPGADGGDAVAEYGGMPPPIEENLGPMMALKGRGLVTFIVPDNGDKAPSAGRRAVPKRFT